MVKYLKKSKIRKLLLGLGYPVPELIHCGYKFYRGSEWLTCESVICYCCRSYMSIERIQYNEEEVGYDKLDRKLISGAEYADLLKGLGD